MRVIGKEPWSVKVVCPRCELAVEIVRNDIEFSWVPAAPGGCRAIFGVTCPGCNAVYDVRPDIPRRVSNEIERRYYEGKGE